MIRAEIKNIKGNAGDIETKLIGTTKVILAEYEYLVKALKTMLEVHVGEEAARHILENITKEALEPKEITQEDINRKFEEVKKDPEKAAKLLKALFED